MLCYYKINLSIFIQHSLNVTQVSKLFQKHKLKQHREMIETMMAHAIMRSTCL